MKRTLLSRRHWLAAVGAGASLAALPPQASAFGAEGAFHPRELVIGDSKLDEARRRGLAEWSAELVRRTSAPGRLVPKAIRVSAHKLVAEPFVVLAGSEPIRPLHPREVLNLRRFFAIGGVLFVDDSAPDRGEFRKSVERELKRVLPSGLVRPIPEKHVIYHSFYLLRSPVGRVARKEGFHGISRHGHTQVIFSNHDLLGALALTKLRTPAFAATPDGSRQREMARRLAVNLAMYVLCSTYKDDQVHAPMLMRRRAVAR